MDQKEFQKMNEEFKINLINNIEDIKTKLQQPKHWNRVVVSTDFIYAVINKDGYASVSVIGGVDCAARLPRIRANEIAETFYAENGYGQINWQTMGEHEYLKKLLEMNENTLTYLNKA